MAKWLKLHAVYSTQPDVEIWPSSDRNTNAQFFFETRYICTVYTVSQKVYRLMFDNNFGKCAPIIKILLSSDSWENSLCAHTKTSTSAVKFENPKMLLIFTASSTNCWHVPDDTLRTSFNIWQYLDRLSQDCSQWVTDYHFEVCQTTSQINS